MQETKTWLIIGASRGIGLEFVRQALAQGHRVIATARSASTALDALLQDAPNPGAVLACDVSSSEGIDVWTILQWKALEYYPDVHPELHRSVRENGREEDRLCRGQCWDSEVPKCTPLTAQIKFPFKFHPSNIQD
jgi:nucleoside-diphosphate-sugar epimerase